MLSSHSCSEHAHPRRISPGQKRPTCPTLRLPRATSTPMQCRPALAPHGTESTLHAVTSHVEPRHRWLPSAASCSTTTGARGSACAVLRRLPLKCRADICAESRNDQHSKFLTQASKSEVDCCEERHSGVRQLRPRTVSYSIPNSSNRRKFLRSSGRLSCVPHCSSPIGEGVVR